MKMKALSPLVSMAILVVLSISLASLVAPWMYELVISTSNQTGTELGTQVKCRQAGLDFDADYGYYGVDWNFTGNGTDWLKAKVINTGNIDLWGFSFEVTLSSSSGESIMHYSLTDAGERTEANPVRSSQSAILEANITSDINSSVYTLYSVKVLNGVCKTISPEITV